MHPDLFLHSLTISSLRILSQFSDRLVFLFRQLKIDIEMRLINWLENIQITQVGKGD